ncbi:MAG: hypothetical protein V7678_04410 [Brevundimonas sp.]
MSSSASNSNRLRLILAAVVFVMILGAAGAMLLRGEPAPDTPEPAPEPKTTEPVQTPAIPLPPPPLTRAELLDMVEAAASAYAAGEPAPEDQAGLAGRQFRIRIPFGCYGPRRAGSESSAGWEYADEGRTIRLSVAPEAWADTAFVAQLGGGPYEAVEGFWIPRPWMASDACPPIRVDPLGGGAPAASPQTVGLAAFFEADSSRVNQRGDRPWQAAVRAPEGETLERPAGFHLIVEGRLEAFADGRPVRCNSAGPDQRPVCLIRMQREYVAFAPIGSDEIIQEWRS